MVELMRHDHLLRLRRALLVCLMASAPLLMPHVAQAADLRNGAKLYNSHCSNCHGMRGNASMPGVPDLNRSGGMMKPNSELVNKIERGGGMMPAFRGLLSRDEILDVISYMRAFY